jgi:hypothetical protein
VPTLPEGRAQTPFEQVNPVVSNVSGGVVGVDVGMVPVGVDVGVADVPVGVGVGVGGVLVGVDVRDRLNAETEWGRAGRTRNTDS